MHWPKCKLLAVVLCAVYFKYSNAETESPTGSTDSVKETTFASSASTQFRSSVETDSGSSPILISSQAETGETSALTQTTVSDASDLKWEEKRDVKNATFEDIKPFFLFPILPFLFPKEIEDSAKDSGNGGVDKTQNHSDAGEGKPFIFFDFAFNIRQIPFSNGTESSTDSKITNVKKLSESTPLVDSKKNSNNRRKRRNAKHDKAKLFDDFSLFPDSELDEFFPKPDLFFPDLPFRPKSVKKLSRRKRDMKKSDLKNANAFDKAFVRAKRELQGADPILNFLKGAERSFGGNKRETDDFFNDLPDLVKPSFNWAMQRDSKASSDRDPLGKRPESPMIIFDKVVKIGEYHVRDKNKGKKKETSDPVWKFLGGDNQDLDDILNDQSLHNERRNVPEDVNDERKRRQLFKRTESKEIRIVPLVNASADTVTSTANAVKGDATGIRGTESTENSSKGGLVRMRDSLKSRLDGEIDQGSEDEAEHIKRKTITRWKKASYDDLKRNITKVLNQFLTVVRNSEVGDREYEESFDWTEKETLQNPSDTGSEPFRTDKDTRFEDDHLDTENKSRRVARLNYLFLTVTLPTVCVLAMLLLGCFFWSRVRGKICTKLFKPRQVLIVEDDTLSQYPNKNPTKVKKTQVI